jgi:hypothetical protein
LRTCPAISQQDRALSRRLRAEPPRAAETELTRRRPATLVAPKPRTENAPWF